SRNTANKRSAIPRISRLSVVLPTALPLPVWSELGDLSILVYRDDWVGIHGRASLQVTAKPGIAKRSAVLGGLEQPLHLVAVLSIEQGKGLRGVVEYHAGHPLRHVVYITTGAAPVLEREVSV